MPGLIHLFSAAGQFPEHRSRVEAFISLEPWGLGVERGEDLGGSFFDEFAHGWVRHDVEVVALDALDDAYPYFVGHEPDARPWPPAGLWGRSAVAFGPVAERR